MLRNYLIVAVRNLLRNKLYTFINVFGLGLGIACCLLIALFVHFEWSHDRFHAKGDRIYRVLARVATQKGDAQWEVLYPHTVADALRDDVPGVERASAVMLSSARIGNGDRVFRQRLGLVSPDFLSIFSFRMVAGNPQAALSQPDAIVVSEGMAKRLFEDPGSTYENVLGRSLTCPGNAMSFTVTGVIADVPAESSLQFSGLIRVDHWQKFSMNYSNGGYACMYVLLESGVEPADVASTLSAVARKQMAKHLEDLRTWKVIGASEEAYALSLQPLTQVYWNQMAAQYEISGNLTAALILSALAVIVLIIAASNFTSLSVARSTSRAVEVGVRRVLGAGQGQVARQFWSEAMVMVLLGLPLGLSLAQLVLPAFNGLVRRSLDLASLASWPAAVLTAAVAVVVALIAGLYPAAIASRQPPVQTLKGRGHPVRRNVVTCVLVVLQYAISTSLIACVVVMLSQHMYVLHKDLGYDQEEVAVVGVPDEAQARLFKTEILKDSRIAAATVSDRAFTTGSSAAGYHMPDGRIVGIRSIRVDKDYLAALRIPLAQGRNLREEPHEGDVQEILVNETLVKELGLKDPLGKTLPKLGSSNLQRAAIVGVVHDFHIDSLHRSIAPLLMHTGQCMGPIAVLARLSGNDVPGTVDFLRNTWRRIAPEEQFRLSFLGDNLANQYREDTRWLRIVSYASVLAVVIACLGLFGLASLAVARRTKEIGLRKVLGATVMDLLGVLSREFIGLLIVANAIAWPAAYLGMHRWLDGFAYRIEMGPGLFALAGGLVLAVAGVTVGLQTIKAANRNPVDALRYE